MCRTLSMLAGLIALSLSACTTVISLMPVGDEPVYLEPEEWEGLWVHEVSNNGTSAFASVMVVDAAGGILEVCDPDSYGEPLRVVVRQHTTAGKQARFVSVFDDGWGYVWGRYQRILQNALIIWSPNHEEFVRLVQQGLLAGQYLDEEGLIIEPLSPEQLDLISRDDGGRLVERV